MSRSQFLNPFFSLTLLLVGTLSSCVTAPATPAARNAPVEATPATSATVPVVDDGFKPLFDGKTMTGWKNAYEWGDITVVNAEIHLVGNKKFFVMTDKAYANFIFEGDIHLPEGKANSGFMFRAHVEKNKVFGYQAEVDGDPQRGWSGGLYDEGRRGWFISPKKDDAENVKAFRARAGDAFKRNDWNTYRITCQGKKLKIEVNGVVTTEVEDVVDASGPIGIQHHGEQGATYRFRNLKIKELK